MSRAPEKAGALLQVSIILIRKTLDDGENTFEFPETVKFGQVKTMELTHGARDSQNINVELM